MGTTTKKLDELEKNRKTAAEEGDYTVGGGSVSTEGAYKTKNNGNNTTASGENSRIAALRQYLSDTVGGKPTESDLLKSVREELLNRQKFTYDHNTDPSFGQYMDQAKRNGRLAMEDTMGKAAALTGGYANSYAQSAGQQAYNEHVQEASQMLPEFENLARARYEAETAALTDKYALLRGEHEADLSDYRNRYDIAREDFYAEQDRLDAEKQYEYEKKQREIELLLAMGDYGALDRMGYNTSALRAQQAAEMTAAQADLLKAKAGVGLTNDDISTLKGYNGNENKVGEKISEWVDSGKIDEELAEFLWKYYTVDMDTLIDEAMEGFSYVKK